MSSAQTTETFNCSPEQFLAIVKDYEKYGDFLSEVSSCKVVESSGERKLVEYNIHLIKKMSYRLWMTESEHGVSWSFDSGDIFKVSNGSWNVKDNGEGKALATYAVEAQFKMFIPGAITKALVSKNLPGMIDAYHKRVKELYG